MRLILLMLKYRDLFCKTEIHSTVIWHIAAMHRIIFDRFWWIYMFATYNGINNCFMILEIHQYPCCQIRIDMKFRLHLICCFELKPYFIPPLHKQRFPSKCNEYGLCPQERNFHESGCNLKNESYFFFRTRGRRIQLQAQDWQLSC